MSLGEKGGYGVSYKHWNKATTDFGGALVEDNNQEDKNNKEE